MATYTTATHTTRGLMTSNLIQAELFKNRNASVAIVGNGPVSENLGDIIDKHYIVIRINKYTSDVDKVGKKIDVHVVNTYPGQQFNDTLTLIMEHHSHYNSSECKTALGLRKHYSLIYCIGMITQLEV